MNSLIDTETGKIASRKPGVPLSRVAEPDEGFVIRSWLWSPKDRDYTIENLNESGRRFFEEFESAREYFNGMSASDMKVDLIHYKYGVGHIIKSRILLPKTVH